MHAGFNSTQLHSTPWQLLGAARRRASRQRRAAAGWRGRSRQRASRRQGGARHRRVVRRRRQRAAALQCAVKRSTGARTRLPRPSLALSLLGAKLGRGSQGLVSSSLTSHKEPAHETIEHTPAHTTRTLNMPRCCERYATCGHCGLHYDAEQLRARSAAERASGQLTAGSVGHDHLGAACADAAMPARHD